MKALKVLVIFMTVLLVAGLGLVGYGVVNRAPHGKPGPAAAGVTANSGPVEEARDFGAVEVPVAAGAHIEQMAVAGDRVVLRVSGAGPERLIVLDPAIGRVAGSFVLAPQPPQRQ